MSPSLLVLSDHITTIELSCYERVFSAFLTMTDRNPLKDKRSKSVVHLIVFLESRSRPRAGTHDRPYTLTIWI